MLFGLGVALVLFLAGYWLGDRATKTDEKKIEKSLSARNTEWYGFIKSYLKISKNKDEKSIVSRMLKDIRDQGLVGFVGAEIEVVGYAEDAALDQTQTNDQPSVAASTIDTSGTNISVIDAKKAKLDNISLLLYFGAFLFIASIGLFVAFGDINGTVKTLIILIMGLLLYGLGCWLYQTKPTLKIVGVAFAGIGMAIIPLVGFAAYAYIFDQSQAPLIWFVTSLIVFCVYAHGLWLFKNSFMNYVFIFTTLSLFESMVSVVSAPIYYFGWAMAIMGISLTALAAYKNIWPEFKQSAVQSGQVFVPISVFASIMLVGKSGFWQLGVSLLLATIYSLMQFVLVKDEEREIYLTISHIFALASLGIFTYAATTNIQDVGMVLLVASALQASAFMFKHWPTARMQNYCNVVVVLALLATALSVGRPIQVFIAALVFSAEAYVLWAFQKRDDAYVIATIGLMATPVIFGQYVSSPRISMYLQTILLFVPLTLQTLLLVSVLKPKIGKLLYNSATILLLANVVGIVIFGAFADAVLYTLLISFTMVILGIIYVCNGDKLWLYVISMLSMIPIARTYFMGKELLYTAIVSLFINIAIVLRTKLEFSRWVGAVIWLLIPIALVRSGTVDASLTVYAGLNFIAILGLLFARAVARGVLFFSDKKVLSSYAKNASLAYLFGMLIAAFAAVAFAVFSKDTSLIVLILAGISTILILLGAYVEKHSLYFAPVPLMLQWIIWLGIQPTASGSNSIYIFTLLSGLLAVGIYAISNIVSFTNYKGSQNTNEVLQLSSLASGMVALLSVVVLGNNWAIPLDFIVLIAAFYHKYRHELQATKELIFGLGVLGVVWLMCAFGVKEVQAYSHVLVAAFATLAVWRHYRGEKEQSDSYIIAAVVTATVPLLLQALSGAAGGLYGWWLLIEQIVIMVIGFAINSKFMVRWGLYVAVGSVLYQLRGLGWAALSFLALFVIGIAIYEIQKINKN